MKFDSTDYTSNEWDSYYGAVRAVIDEEGSGNSEITKVEFETPSGFSQLMEVEILTGDDPKNQRIVKLEDVHTIRIKIIGEWEGCDIQRGLANLVNVFKLKATFEKGE